MNNEINIIKKIAGTLILPVGMYFIMMIACYANGKMYYGTMAMWKTLIVDISVSVTCALGIGLQLKYGRFDFSGGAIMLIAAIIAGNMAKEMNDNPVVFFLLCIAICVVLSVITSIVYIKGRLPIVIATIAMALLYEASSCLIFNGSGINIVANMSLKRFSSYPYVLIPLIGAIAVYAYYSYLTVSGKQNALLAFNQQSAVNIGVNEKKNIIISYIFSGIIFGFATTIYASTGLHNASFSSLSSVGDLFSNLLPVFIGFMIGVFCGDTIGIIVGSITLGLMSFGLTAVLNAEMGNAISMVITGIFLLVINVIGSRGTSWINGIKKIFSIKKALANS